LYRIPFQNAGVVGGALQNGKQLNYSCQSELKHINNRLSGVIQGGQR